MSIATLGHYTIRCTPGQLERLRAFYVDVLGLTVGPRPDFPAPGHWLYSGGKPLVHLYASAARETGGQTGALDHIAFDADGIGAVRERLLSVGVPFFERPIAGFDLQQLFLQDPTGIRLEMTFPAQTSAEAGDPRLAVNGSRLAFEVEGTGPALLLLHGGAGDLRMFDRLVPLLSPWYRVIRFDQRDCGGSETARRAYDFDALADDAVAVLHALEESRAHVFGTSFGGLLAQAIAARHPGCVDGLVLSSTWTLGVPFPTMNPRIAEVLGGERTPDTLARAFFSEAFLAREPDAAAFFRRAGRAMSETRAALLRQAQPAALAGIAARTLILGGEDDRVVPFDQSRLLARGIRQARVADPLPGVGHVGAFEAPGDVARLVHEFCG